jgi:acetyl esterase
MTATDQTRMLLDVWEAMGSPSVETMTVADARAMAEGYPRGPGPQVDRIADVTIPGPDGNHIPARVYTPEGEGPFPVLCYFHGGGWVIGSIEMADATARSLCVGAECVVVSPDYRMAPEHPFPAPLEDCFAVTEWAVAATEPHGGDGSRLAVSGGSAGGNLAAGVTMMARDRGGPRLAFQFLEYPATDHDFETGSYRENAEGMLLSRAALIWFWDNYVPDPADRDDPRASPLRSTDLSGLPPALVITAELDPLRDEGEAYGNALAAAGVPTTITRYDGVVHGFFGMRGLIDEATAAQAEAAAALRAAFAEN